MRPWSMMVWPLQLCHRSQNELLKVCLCVCVCEEPKKCPCTNHMHGSKHLKNEQGNLCWNVCPTTCVMFDDIMWLWRILAQPHPWWLPHSKASSFLSFLFVLQDTILSADVISYICWKPGLQETKQKHMKKDTAWGFQSSQGKQRTSSVVVVKTQQHSCHVHTVGGDANALTPAAWKA